MDALEAEGYSCPAKWGGLIPKLTIVKVRFHTKNGFVLKMVSC